MQKDAMPRRKNKSPTKGRMKKGSKSHSRRASRDRLPPVVSTSQQKLLTKRARSHFRMQNHLQSSNALNPNIRPKKHQQFIGPRTVRDITEKIELKQ